MTTTATSSPSYLQPDQWEQVTSKGDVTIATFNTLRKNYNFSKKYWVPEEVSNWQNRCASHKNLIPTLYADILCLQEVEATAFEDLDFLTKEQGYAVLKADLGDTKEAELHSHTKPSIFYKTAKFNVKWVNARSRTVLVLLEDKNTGKSFYLINAHLQAGDESQRCFQMRSALQQLIIHAKAAKIPDEKLTCFIAGDFNATPEQAIHTLISAGKLTEEQHKQYFPKTPFKFSHNFKLEDSHAFLKELRPYTFKWGVKEDALFQTLDYIYSTPNTIQVVAVRDPLTKQQREEMLERAGIPNTYNPSDHLPSAVVFKLA